MLRELLEEQLGPLEDAEFNFALDQYFRNKWQVIDYTMPRMLKGQELDELSMNIDFYRREIAPYVQKEEEARQSEGVCSISDVWSSGVCNKDIYGR